MGIASSPLRDLARALDPVSLAAECGIAPDDWQRQLLIETPDRALLNCARQTGKSTGAALLGLHTALYAPGSLVLLVSPSLRQSSELFRKVLGFYHALPDAEHAAVENTLRIELTNGSRVVSLPGSEGTIRGYSGASLVICDEAARISDELLAAVRPTLATSRGKLVAMSTPWGRRGWFWREWEHGGETWTRYTLRADQCPRITAEFLAEEFRALGELIYRAEYECVFTDSETSMFSSQLIEAALTNDVKPLF